jgi:hypothetical protein
VLLKFFSNFQKYNLPVHTRFYSNRATSRWTKATLDFVVPLNYYCDGYSYSTNEGFSKGDYAAPSSCIPLILLASENPAAEHAWMWVRDAEL